MNYCPTCNQLLAGYGYRCGCGHLWNAERFASFGFDVTDGDVVENLGAGLGIDLETGQLEEEVAPGIDVPVGDLFGGW